MKKRDPSKTYYQRGKIDKSVLKFGIPNSVDDPKYLHGGYIHSTCAASRDGINLCGWPSVGAHCRTGNEGGTAYKPSDDLTCPLCFDCHMDQEANPGSTWWLDHVLKPQMRRRYKDWTNGLLREGL